MTFNELQTQLEEYWQQVRDHDDNRGGQEFVNGLVRSLDCREAYLRYMSFSHWVEHYGYGIDRILRSQQSIRQECEEFCGQQYPEFAEVTRLTEEQLSELAGITNQEELARLHSFYDAISDSGNYGYAELVRYTIRFFAMFDHYHDSQQGYNLHLQLRSRIERNRLLLRQTLDEVLAVQLEDGDIDGLQGLLERLRDLMSLVTRGSGYSSLIYR